MIKGNAKAQRAIDLLEQGMEPRQVAKECGYKDAGTMMAQINRLENRKAVTVLTEKKAEMPAGQPEAKSGEKKETQRELTPAEVEADCAKAAMDFKTLEALHADCGVKTEHIVLGYNRETDSVRANVRGLRFYLWLDGRRAQDGIAQMLMEMSAACRALAAMIKGSY